MLNQGTFDGGSGQSLLSAMSGIVDLSQGTLKNTSDMSLNVGAGALLLLPAGVTASNFAAVTGTGLIHTGGTTLDLGPGQSVSGWGSINDPVNCQGTIAPTSGGSININNGLVLSTGGNVNLNGGSLTVNDALSGISGGSLTANTEDIGKGGTGTFTQTAGTNTTSGSYLYLGYNSGDKGTYNLSGTGLLQRQNYGQTIVCVGFSGTGVFTQSGGSVNEFVYLGYNSGSVGTYTLSGGQVNGATVGNSGVGTFTQSGGTNSGSLYLGTNSTGTGSYNMTAGQLSPSLEEVGNYGTGTFTQSGGTNTVSSQLILANNGGGSGTFVLSNTGQLTAPAENVGVNGTGVFSQSGGTNTISGSLDIGCNSGSKGTYSLSGGALSAASEYIGLNSATGFVQQTGGTNTTGYVSISSTGQYLFSGGTLAISGIGLANQGLFAGGSGLLSATSAIVHLSQGTLQNVGSMSVSVGAGGLLLLPAGVTAASFASATGTGIIHTAGTTLTVAAGQSVNGWGSINDPVVCQGTIAAASGGSINLGNGLVLSGGSVSLLAGSLTVNDAASGISGGTLSATNLYVGSGGTGTFTHSAGTTTLFEQPLSRLASRRQRQLQPRRRQTLGRHAVRRLLRHGKLHPVRRNQHGQQCPVSGLQHGQQRDLCLERRHALRPPNMSAIRAPEPSTKRAGPTRARTSISATTLPPTARTTWAAAR